MSRVPRQWYLQEKWSRYMLDVLARTELEDPTRSSHIGTNSMNRISQMRRCVISHMDYLADSYADIPY